MIDSRSLFDSLVNLIDHQQTIANFKASKYYKDKINVKEFLTSPPLPEGITKVGLNTR